MRYFILAGEASGDLHAAALVRELLARDPQAECVGWGGDLMAQAGARVLKHYRELAFMGFAEVVKNLPAILRNFRLCREQIADFRPDALILIDYPGFNLRMARWAKLAGHRVFYYISPQIWAWHRSRVHQVKRYVDRMFVILPFEQEFYSRYGVEVDFVGHPLLDVVAAHQPAADFHARNGLDPQRPIVALLPGSRRQEVERILPAMAAVAGRFPSHQFVIAGAPAQPAALYRRVLSGGYPGLPLVQGQTYDLLAHAQAALVGSGTATLETALFDVPEVVCYRGSALSYAIARRLVDVPFISLVNLVAGKELVKELIQDDLNPDQLEQALAPLLQPEGRQRLRDGYAELRRALGSQGAARATAAKIQAYLTL